MARRSIEDTNYDEAVTVDQAREEVQGQPQARPAEPFDGKVQVDETRVRLDQPILDPNHELAVQIPEGSGASTANVPNAVAEAFRAGTAEEQFAAAESGDSEPEPAPARKAERAPRKAEEKS